MGIFCLVGLFGGDAVLQIDTRASYINVYGRTCEAWWSLSRQRYVTSGKDHDQRETNALSEAGRGRGES